MASEQRCVVGVDGLPLGTKAALALSGTIVEELDLTTDAGRPLDLDRRVAEAIRLGEEHADRPVDELHVALIDDRSAGEVLSSLGAQLSANGVLLLVVQVPPGRQSDSPDTTEDIGAAWSTRRARLAALSTADGD